jgi:hypothetical protein
VEAVPDLAQAVGGTITCADGQQPTSAPQGIGLTRRDWLASGRGCGGSSTRCSRCSRDRGCRGSGRRAST